MTGSLDIIGLGPGGPEHRTPQAAEAIREAQVVIGYGPYVDQAGDLLGPAHEVVRGRIGEETARAEEALARAAAGARVALVSSGDAGVYGMAARTLARAAELDIEVRVIPGLTAALAAAALLGAPLADDFAVLSLSDRQVPWERVARRLEAVAAAGLALCLYNPRSGERPLDRALEAIRKYRPGDTPVALVTDAARPGERVHRTILSEVDPDAVGMRTVIVVGGESATAAGPWLVAARGAGA
jgi:precorrin-3B C17-methyltransferase